MKRQTFIDYAKVIVLSLIITFITALYGIAGYFIDNIQSNEFAEVYKDLRSFTIVIDAGHGGEDGGAVGHSGALEKDINLAISKYLEDYFKLTDIDVVMTRESDILLYEAGQESRKKFNDLNNRLKICNSTENPLLISIHQNKFPLEKYNGLQVYYSENSEESKEVANIIQSNTKEYLQKNNNRKIKASGRNIFILDRAKCPAVLVECGFLSNPEEESNLVNAEYQKKIAFVIFSSVVEFLSDSGNY